MGSVVVGHPISGQTVVRMGLSRMSDELPARLILIVTGSTLRAEELDRPLAYYLKQQVERLVALRGRPPPARSRPK